MVPLLSRVVGPFFSRLFPEIPKNHPATGSIIMNFSANILGLDNAATPLGLKAMNELQEINPDKDTASNAQIMFLVLNASGLTIIPISIMADRAMLGSVNPTSIFIPTLIATFCSTFVGLLYVCIRQKINLFDPVILGLHYRHVDLHRRHRILFFRFDTRTSTDTIIALYRHYYFFNYRFIYCTWDLKTKDSCIRDFY